MTTQEKLIEETLESVNARFETAQPQRILEWADKTFGPRMAVMSSFGLEDVALWDMMWKINRDASIKTLDTFRLPTETIHLWTESPHATALRLRFSFRMLTW